MSTKVANTLGTVIDNMFYNKSLSNDIIAGHLYSIISDHLIRFLIELSSYMHNSFKKGNNQEML